MVSSYAILIAIAFLLGMAGSSFAVGVGFISPWFPKEKQGAALGVYGLGNAGQSLIVFLGPLMAHGSDGRTYFSASLRCWSSWRFYS